MSTSQKLNLGCGQFKKEGYINLDMNPNAPADVTHDLNALPYPFEDNSFELIEMDHVLEHLDRAFDVMREVHRLLKPGGRVIIKVPHFSRGFTHAEHCHGFDVTFPYYFDPDFKGGYQNVTFRLEKMRLTWFAQPYLKKTVLNPLSFHLARVAGKVIDVLANLSPFICSRLWCYWVGGMEEIRFEMVAVKA